MEFVINKKKLQSMINKQAGLSGDKESVVRAKLMKSIGVSPQYFNHIEKGHFKYAGIGHLIRMKEWFALNSIEELLEGKNVSIKK